MRYDCTSLRTVAIGMNRVSGSVGVASTEAWPLLGSVELVPVVVPVEQ